MPISLSCICTVDQRRLAEETSCGDSVRSHFQSDRSPRGACPGLVTKGSRFVAQLRRAFHGVDGHQGGAFRVGREAVPQSRARVSPMVPMQHHLAKQRAMSPCSMSVDSPHTPAVRRKRQLHRGATETRPRSTGSRTPALPLAFPRLPRSVQSNSQNPGTSVSEY